MQDMIEVTGNHQNAPIIGVLGGLLGQFIMCFSAIHKKWKKELMGDPSDPEDQGFLCPKVIQNFLFLYIDAKLRTEKLVLCVGKAVEDFLN